MACEMPIYEFHCEECDSRFEELAAAGAEPPRCPSCDSEGARRLLSSVSPPSRRPRGAKVRDSESRRREREAARGARLAEAKAKRAKGERP
jgi:putative FmdB family regulatory protein